MSSNSTFQPSAKAIAASAAMLSPASSWRTPSGSLVARCQRRLAEPKLVCPYSESNPVRRVQLRHEGGDVVLHG